MNRKDRTDAKLTELFDKVELGQTGLDPEFTEISRRFIYGDIFQQGNLDLRQRLLISLVVLTTIGDQTELSCQATAALKVGVQPREMKEALYQCAPFIGFPAVFRALQIVNAILLDHHVSLPLETEDLIPADERFDKGRAIQFPIYGDRIRSNLSSLPGEHRENLPKYLTELCFGDFYTRDGLDLKDRELLVLCVLCALGDTEGQIRSHAAGNLKVGNSRETILSAVTQCLPWIGFPRTLNTINIIKDITIE
ncbi:MAG: 4-carboxymuconolactone decarboxylase [Anaerolineales bacterium]|nr:MAG: 4-carboxymuconolactone decarboxylase [Anaerolineales bacterium]